MAKMTEPSQSRILIAMPAYNEERYIGSLVLKARQYANEVLVLDDGSTDHTTQIAQLAGATVIRHPKNQGKGAAVQTILAEAKRRDSDVLVLLDADSQHDPDEIPYLIRPIGEGFDLVIGSRQKQIDRIPRYRRVGQKVLLHLTRFLSGENLTDSESGFKAFSRKAISDIELNENGFAVEAEIIARAADKHLKITQIPISAIYTKDGSTLNPLSHGLGVLLRIIAMVSERRPLFFFGLGGGISVVLGIIAGVRALWVFSTTGTIPFGTTIMSVMFLIVGIFSMFTGIILNVLRRRI